MSADEWLVIAAGLGAIAWVNWYFFLAERKSSSAAKSGREAESPSTSPAARRD